MIKKDIIKTLDGVKLDEYEIEYLLQQGFLMQDIENMQKERSLDAERWVDYCNENGMNVEEFLSSWYQFDTFEEFLKNS